MVGLEGPDVILGYIWSEWRERSVEESEVEGKGDGYSKQVRWWWVSESWRYQVMVAEVWMALSHPPQALQ